MSPFREIAVLPLQSQNRQPAYRARKRHSTARLWLWPPTEALTEAFSMVEAEPANALDRSASPAPSPSTEPTKLEATDI